jgi:hypothetical protein
MSSTAPTPEAAGPYRTATTTPLEGGARRQIPDGLRRLVLFGELSWPSGRRRMWPFLALPTSWGLSALLAPALAWRLLRGRRHLRLLEDGLVADARLVRERSTPSFVRCVRVHELTLDFADPSARIHRVVVRTPNHERLRQEGRYQLLHPPDHPRRAVLLADIRGRPRINADGAVSFDAGIDS